MNFFEVSISINFILNSQKIVGFVLSVLLIGMIIVLVSQQRLGIEVDTSEKYQALASPPPVSYVNTKFRAPAPVARALNVVNITSFWFLST